MTPPSHDARGHVAQASDRPPWLSNALFPYESRYLELDGHRIHYIDEGSGPLLLMLHGNPTWSFLYRHLVGRLASSFRCVALDYPGFGLSTAAEGYDHLPASHASVVERFVLALDLQGITPFVQDWGGPIGLDMASRHPERIRSLIIGNTMAWPVSDDPHFVRFSRLMGGPIGGFAIRHFNAFVNVMIPVGTPRTRLSREVMQAYRRPTRSPARREATHIFPREIVGSEAFLEQLASRLGTLADKPTLLLWGDRDVAFREKERLEFERRFRHASTVVLHGAGHFIQEDAPDEIVEAVRQWWPEVEGR
jgi:haloalkane dehalogenase